MPTQGWLARTYKTNSRSSHLFYFENSKIIVNGNMIENIVSGQFNNVNVYFKQPTVIWDSILIIVLLFLRVIV